MKHLPGVMDSGLSVEASSGLFRIGGRGPCGVEEVGLREQGGAPTCSFRSFCVLVAWLHAFALGGLEFSGFFFFTNHV